MFSLQSILLRQTLLGGAALVAVWLFHRGTIAPLKLREEEHLRQRADLKQRLESARKVIADVKDSEQKVAKANAVLNHLLGEKTKEAAMVTFPGDIKQHFSRFGIPSAVVRLVTTQEESKLPGYIKIYWSVGLPIPKTDRNVEGLLFATEQLEQQDRYIKVTDFALQADAADASLRNASINIVILGQK